jgi:hypothetical protein
LEHNAAHMASEDDGVESEDEREIDLESSFPPAPPNPSPNTFPPASSSINDVPSNLRPELMRRQRYAKESRARRRAAQQELHPPEDRQLKSAALKKRMNLEAIPTPTDAEELKATSTGWTGAQVPTEKEAFMLEEVTSALYNMCHVRWDGR